MKSLLAGERSAVRSTLGLTRKDGRFEASPTPRHRSQDVADEWFQHLKRLNFTEATLRNYRTTMRVFFRMFPNLKLQYLSAEHIERFILRDGLSPRAAGTQLMNLSSFCRYLVKRGLLKENPCRKVEKPRFQINPRPAPSWQDFLALRRACKTIEEATVLETLYFTGMRSSEFRSVRLRDVDFSARRITVVAGKGGKVRVVMFPERVASLLREYIGQTPCRRSPDDFLFICTWYFTPQGRHTHRVWKWAEGEFPGITAALTGEQPYKRVAPITIPHVLTILRRLGKSAGLPYHLTTHILRHGFIRLCKVRGVPVEMTAKLAGHDIGMTVKIYGQLSDDDLQTAYDRALSQINEGVS